jgi:hypothetical protein
MAAAQYDQCDQVKRNLAQFKLWRRSACAEPPGQRPAASQPRASEERTPPWVWRQKTCKAPTGRNSRTLYPRLNRDRAGCVFCPALSRPVGALVCYSDVNPGRRSFLACPGLACGRPLAFPFICAYLGASTIGELPAPPARAFQAKPTGSTTPPTSDADTTRSRRRGRSDSACLCGCSVLSCAHA